MFILEWLDQWTLKGKLIGGGLVLALIAGVTFGVLSLTSSTTPTAPAVPPATTAPASPAHESSAPTATPPAKPSATPTSSTTPAGPSATQSLKLLHYHVVSVNGSTTTWAPPVPSQPIVKTTPTTATAFFPGFSCYIPVAGTGMNGATFNVGQLIIFGTSVLKPNDVGRTVTKITFTQQNTPVGYAYCVRT